MYIFKPITMNNVDEISTWKYNGFMKTIFMKPYYDNFEKIGRLIGPDNCDGYAVFKDDELFGLFEYYHKDYLEIGLAINPKYVGQGFSKSFILDGIQFAIKAFNYQKNIIQLVVEEGNKAAYYSYIKAGFKEVKKTDENEILMYYYLK